MAKEPGFSDDQAKYQAPKDEDHRWNVKIVANAQAVSPAAATIELGADRAATASFPDGVLTLVSRRAAIHRIREMVKAHREKHDLTGSAVDELIAKGRETAARGD